MFSIVIPLFNKAATIRATVASVLDQSFRDFELIVVDDGSTDGSVEQLAGIGDPRLKIIRQHNRGEGRARNRGIESATAQWIALLDADDRWMPDHLDELDRIRTRFPDAGMIGTRWVEVDRLDVPDPLPRTDVEPEQIDYFDEVLAAPLLCSSTAAIRRSAYDDVGGFTDWPAGADIEYWVRVALKWPVARSTAITAFYLRSADRPQIAPLSPPGREMTEGVAPLIALLRRDRDHLPASARAAVDRYILALWTSRFRFLVSQSELDRARLLSAIAPARLAPSDRLRRLVIRLPDRLAIPSIRAVSSTRSLAARALGRPER